MRCIRVETNQNQELFYQHHFNILKKIIMNKIIKHILCAFIFVGLISCSEDKGNYDYSSINSVDISSIEKEYYIVVGDVINITPEIDFKLISNEENLSYSWTIEDIEVAQTRNLDYAVSNSHGFGEKLCRYTITDKANKMKYFMPFKLIILNPFNWGYYFLTKGENDITELAFFSVLNDNTSFVYADGIGQIKFGKKPISISGVGGSVKIEGKTTYCFKFDVMTAEGEYPIISSETATFYPSATINKEKFFDQDKGFEFSPTQSVTMRMSGVTFYCSGGELVAYTESFLYYPSSTHNSLYKWSNPIQSYSGAQLAYVFDENSKKYYVAKPELTNADLGIVSDNLLLNRVVPLADFPPMNGHTILRTATGPNASINKPSVITTTEGKLNVIEFEYNTGAGFGEEDFEKGSYLKTTSIDLPGAGKNTKIAEAEKDWYISVGNKIYIAPKDRISEIREFATIDSKYGEISDIALSVRNTKLIVATYNNNSSSPRKGSVLYIGASSGEVISAYQNVINDCVSILSANFYYIYGVEE